MEQKEIENEIIAEKKSISNLYKFLLIFIALVVFVFALFYYNTDSHNKRLMVDSSVFDVRLQNIENSIAAHEKRIAKVEEDELHLQKNFDLVQKSPVTEGKVSDEVKERIDDLDKEIKKIHSSSDKQSKEGVYQAIKLISSFNRFSRMVTLGRPFSSELSAFIETFGTENDKVFDEAIAALTPYSDSGIPTRSALLDAFDDAVDAFDRSQKSPPENAGFWETIIFNISHLITIRKVDKNQMGDSEEAFIGRTFDYLNNGETEAAIAEIKSLPDNVRSNFSAWLEEAQIVSITPSMIDELEEKVMKKAFVNQESEPESQKTE